MDRIIVSLGTYSGGLLGYELSGTSKTLYAHQQRNVEINVEARLVFAYAAHVSCVKAACSSGSLLLTGSSDETIKVFELGANRERGTIQQHQASITAIELMLESQPFSTRNGSTASVPFALTGAEDGTLCLWRTRDWSLVTQLKGHVSRIEAIASHPTGPLVLTVASGEEKGLRLFDLMRGTCAISQRFDRAPIDVQWSRLKGDWYCVLFEHRLLVRHAFIPNLEASIACDGAHGAFTTMAVLCHEGLVIGDTGGQINGYLVELQVNSDEEVGKITIKHVLKCQLGHQANEVPRRVRCLCSIPNLLDPSSDSNEGATSTSLWFASVDSTGILSFWHWAGSSSSIIQGSSSLPVMPAKESLKATYHSMKHQRFNTMNDDEAVVDLIPIGTVDTQARVTTLCCNEEGMKRKMFPDETAGHLKAQDGRATTEHPEQQHASCHVDKDAAAGMRRSGGPQRRQQQQQVVRKERQKQRQKKNLIKTRKTSRLHHATTETSSRMNGIRVIKKPKAYVIRRNSNNSSGENNKVKFQNLIRVNRTAFTKPRPSS